MKKSLLPVKALTLIQNIVCLLVMLVIVIMSFGPIFTAEVNKTDKAVDIFEKVVNSVGGNESVEMPDTVEISAPYVVKSVGSLGKVLKSALNTLKDASAANDAVNNAQSEMQNDPMNAEGAMEDASKDIENLQNSASELSAELKDEDFVSFLTLVVVVITAFGENILLGIVYVALIVLAIMLPIYATIRFIIALVSFFCHLVSPDRSFSTISKGYGAVLAMFPALWLMKIIAPAVKFSTGVTLMVALLVAGLVINFVASRLKAYTPAQFKYINMLQITSAVAVIGYFVFMLNISGMNMFGHIWEALPAFAKSAKLTDLILPYLMVMAMIYLLSLAAKYVAKIACRLACMVPAPKVAAGCPVKYAKDTYMFSAALSLGLIAAPIVLMVAKFNLDLGDDMISFILFSAGIAVMFIAELLMVILKKTLCANVTAEDVHAVLTGCPTGDTTVEQTAVTEPEATATVEEPVAENVPEQTPPEETTEEPAQEPVTEEAPSEDTVEIVIEMSDNENK